MDAVQIAEKAIDVAADLCVYTNKVRPFLLLRARLVMPCPPGVYSGNSRGGGRAGHVIVRSTVEMRADRPRARPPLGLATGASIRDEVTGFVALRRYIFRNRAPRAAKHAHRKAHCARREREEMGSIINRRVRTHERTGLRGLFSLPCGCQGAQASSPPQSRLVCTCASRE